MNDYNIDSNTSYCLGMSLTIEALLHKADFVKKVILSNKAEKNKQLDLLFELDFLRRHSNHINYILNGYFQLLKNGRKRLDNLKKSI